MFYLAEIEDVVGIPPKMFNADLDIALKDAINEDKIGRIDKDLGVILGVVKINKTGSAKVLMGDSSAYVDVEYSLLCFKPEVHAVYEGQIKEVAEFGAFVNVGPFDALIHVSQLMDDFVNFDPNTLSFSGKESQRTLAKGDVVLSKLVTVSYKNNTAQTKIGMTMRQSGLGKPEWWDNSIKQTLVSKDNKDKKVVDKKDKPKLEKIDKKDKK